MNSEDKIYSKIRNASHKGEKDFPGMDKVWNRVEEKLDNTIVVQKKNTWQKLAIAATVLLSFSIIYQFMSNDEIIKDKVINNTTNPIIVSNDSVKKIIDKAKEVVVENDISKKPANTVNPYYNSGAASAESSFYPEETKSSEVIDDAAKKMEFRFDSNLALTEKEKVGITTELNKNISTENEVSFRNSALNFTSSNTNNGYLAPNKKYEVPAKEVKSKYKAPKLKSAAAPVQQNKDLVVIDGVAMDKSYNAETEFTKLDMDDIKTTVLTNPLYIINGVEYSEESLFGKTPTSPYAPLDKQKITSTNILQPADATKIYGKKGEKGIVIITTKDGKPADK
ncbi:hypothetical protein [Flavobacterium terrigena]|uniref:TonB-dependent outer membrane receptor, SusC/RagA subfamily, signature region n=1 Tax=Flavobacterium terrigena TaxID=402734 RepID=A0A1H6QYB8_9FLAO|nr:hypothetical protein [Flavobacterium terrigena]SEI47096.1 hypothetical protein SAMN05660918_0756 [Flavobacterium terrigena]